MLQEAVGRQVVLRYLLECGCCTKKATRTANDGSDIWVYIATHPPRF